MMSIPSYYRFAVAGLFLLYLCLGIAWPEDLNSASAPESFDSADIQNLVSSRAHTTYLAEGFETWPAPASGWYQTGMSSYPYTWYRGTFQPYEGTACAACEYTDGGFTGQEEFLMTPIMNLSTAGSNLSVSFYWKADPDSTGYISHTGSGMWLEISTDGSTFPTALWTDEDNPPDGNWNKQIVSLMGYNQPIIRLEWRYRSWRDTPGATIFLDSVEIYEESTPAGPIHVTSLADAGAGTLREAITTANSNPGPDTILFDVSGTIPLASALPTLTDDSTVIQGSSAPKATVIIDGLTGGMPNGLPISSSGNQIEGLTFRQCNDAILLSGSARRNRIGPDNKFYLLIGNGISLNGVGVDSNFIYGNDIYNNQLYGIYLTGASFNQIGGYDGAEKNLIYDNIQGNIYIYGNSDSNRVINNSVGEPGWAATQTGDGITIDFNCDGNLVDSNAIANNGGDGIAVVINSRLNTITRNIIYDNEGLGIDLADDGVTANDAGDGDSGPNDLLNFPVIDSIPAVTKAPTPIYGHAGANDRIEFFVSKSEGSLQTEDPTGYGEAYEYFGATDADGSGNFVFTPDPGIWLPSLSRITCTATDALGNTSEFALNVTYTQSADTPPIQMTSLADDGAGSLRDAIDQANSNIGPDTIIFEISGTIALATALPALTDDGTIIIGNTAPGGYYSVILDGSAVSSGDGFTIESSDNRIQGLVITGFPENGIAITGASSTNNLLLNNLIYDNGGLAIDLGGDGVTLNDPGDTDTGPNDFLNYPEVDSAISQADATYMIYGRAAVDATVELFVAHPADDDTKPPDPSGHGEAWSYLGTTTASPTGEFTYHDLVSPHFTTLTATATDVSGNTSEMSPNFDLLPRPLIIMAIVYDPVKGGDVPQNGINILVTDPNGDQFGMDASNVLIDEIPGDQFYFITASEDDSMVIPEPIVGDYTIDIIGSGDGATGSMYASIIKVDGSLECILIVDGDIPATGNFTSFAYTYDEDEAIYTNGDANNDCECNVGDAVFIINYVFNGGPPPVPVLAGDANCSGDVNVGDAVYVINYVFKGGDPPCYFEPN